MISNEKGEANPQEKINSSSGQAFLLLLFCTTTVGRSGPRTQNFTGCFCRLRGHAGYTPQVQTRVPMHLVLPLDGWVPLLLLSTHGSRIERAFCWGVVFHVYDMCTTWLFLSRLRAVFTTYWSNGGVITSSL